MAGTRYPTITAGDRATADLLNSMLPLFAYKDANTARTSTTTLADDPDLVIAVEAVAIYKLTASLRVLGAAAGDFKMQFNTPGATGSGSWGAYMLSLAAATVDDTKNSIRTTMDNPRSIGTVSTSSGQAILIQGLVRTSTAGNFTLSWAQDTSSATATTLEADSWVELKRVA